jgi:adenosine kinase
MAYDTLMSFEDRFKNLILPDQIHKLNVSFLTPQMQRRLGGCAGNIAYNLKMLGGDPLIMATVGEDFELYSSHLKALEIASDHVKEIEGQFTAQAFITSDLDNNQINAFHPGAMNFSHLNHIDDAADVELGIISPDGRDGMLLHGAQFAEANIPFIFDPGQQLPMFSGKELLNFCEQATYVVTNDYESQMMVEKTACSIEQLAERVDTFIVTRGSNGSSVYNSGKVLEIGTAPISGTKEPTGCGDAYRAGLLFGLSKGLGWQECGQIASLCGAIKIEHSGTQEHRFTLDQFAQRYTAAFAQAWPL